MYTMLILAIVGAVVGSVLYCKFGEDRSFFCGAAFLGAIIGLVVGAFAALIIADWVPTKETTQVRTLSSIHSSTALEGTFVFGTGSVSSPVIYRFLVVNEDGSLTPQEIYGGDVLHFVEDPQLVGKGFWITTVRNKDASVPIAKWAIVGENEEVVVREEFRVPAHSVVHDFKIN
jgi:uncharacterized membrane protein YeaQ/YmgE (transglycosylase-associated protein family)